MFGLVFFPAIIVFAVLLICLSCLLTRWLRPSIWRALLRVVIVVALFPMPLIDEIIGKRQFEALCKANGIESIDQSLIKGKRVQIHDDYFSWEPLPGKILPMKVTTTRIKDADTGQELANFKNYSTHGGWLLRVTTLDMQRSNPFLFHGSGCGRYYPEVLSRNNAVWFNN